jgi:hypothetical protein
MSRITDKLSRKLHTRGDVAHNVESSLRGKRVE